MNNKDSVGSYLKNYVLPELVDVYLSEVVVKFSCWGSH